MAEKKKWESFVTPKGVASWPHLNVPDTQYDERGVYHTKLVFDPSNPEAAKFLNGLQERLDAYAETLREGLPPAKAAKLVINDIVKDEEDRETGEATGKKVVSFKMYATSLKDGVTKTREPRYFDAKGTKLTKAQLPKLSGGSVLKIEYSISEYNKPKGSGITLYLSNIQIVKAVEYSAGGSKFGAEEGFTAADEPEDERMASAEDDAAEAGAEDGDF